MGRYFMEGLKKIQGKYPVIGDLRGLGLMIGMELVQPDGAPDRALTAKVCACALDHGPVSYTHLHGTRCHAV